VVFKYTNITIATGKKVTFKNHATRAPVVWLVSGNVSIEGMVDLSGESARDVWSSSLDGWAWQPTHRPLGGRLTEPGPGGFRGGAPLRGGNTKSAAGFGPGGGRTGPWNSNPHLGTSGGFGLAAGRVDGVGTGGIAYGNPSLIPLIGGSGGGGSEHGLWESWGCRWRGHLDCLCQSDQSCFCPDQGRRRRFRPYQCSWQRWRVAGRRGRLECFHRVVIRDAETSLSRRRQDGWITTICNCYQRNNFAPIA
jgi:hypothetical protein